MPKIVRVQSLGGPEVLRVVEEASPQPKAGDVRIKVGAIGLNRVETMFRDGGFGVPALPSKIGYEAAGLIDAIGAGVTDFAVGDRVALIPGLSMEEYGAYGEEILYPANMLVRLPDGQSMVEAAATWMQYFTAYALIGVGHIKKGDYVVITAASSSVGIGAIQIVNVAGGIPIAVTRGRAKATALLKLGAAHVVVSSEQDLAQTVRGITGGRGADICFDAVAGETLPALALASATGGIIIVYGSLDADVIALPAHIAMLGNLTIRGFSANHLLADPEQRRDAIAYIHAGIASGALKPVIDRTFALDDIVAAHKYLESNMQLGKIVVTVSQ